jgi:cytochrome b6-f complex iron-sulfur subunit
MALIDDLAQPVPDGEMTRRRALLALGSGALAAAGLGTIVTGIQFMRPNVLFEPATRFSVGRPEEIAVGEVLALPRRKVFVVHGSEGFYAMSSICTHLGCMVRREAPGGSGPAFTCPCHGSRFDLEGKVKGGPAPRPLDRFELTAEGDKLVVDISRPVPEGTVMLP